MDFLLTLLYCCCSFLGAGETERNPPSETQAGTTRTIDLDQARKNTETLTTDAIAQAFEYIALETSDDCLISGWDNIHVFPEHIVVIPQRNVPLLFDRQGKFLNRIGRRGHGPGEFTEPIRSIFVNAETRQAVLFTQQKALFFDLQGKFIQEKRLWLSQLGTPAGLDPENAKLRSFVFGGTDQNATVLLDIIDSCVILTAPATLQSFTKINGQYKKHALYTLPPELAGQRPAEFSFFHIRFLHPDYFEYYDGISDYYRIHYDGRTEHPFRIKNSAIMRDGNPMSTITFTEAENYLFITTALPASSPLSRPEIPVYIHLPHENRTFFLSQNKLAPGTAYGIAFWPSDKIPDERAVFEKVEAIDFKRRAEASNDEQAKALGRKLKDDDNPVIVIARLK